MYTYCIRSLTCPLFGNAYRMKDFVGVLASKSMRRTYVTVGMQQGLSSMTMSKRTRHADPNTLLQYGDDDENLFVDATGPIRPMSSCTEQQRLRLVKVRLR